MQLKLERKPIGKPRDENIDISRDKKLRSAAYLSRFLKNTVSDITGRYNVSVHRDEVTNRFRVYELGVGFLDVARNNPAAGQAAATPSHYGSGQAAFGTRFGLDYGYSDTSLGDSDSYSAAELLDFVRERSQNLDNNRYNRGMDDRSDT